ncbi:MULTISPECIES: polyketide synthase [unclassified Caballeronia]|uniref:polyketide synthase n=1 Tax=unclassified Caballeronia TaxID=2646786 RepID=UPI00286D39D9|nr:MULTISPECIES: polyketide synthase [unclassified Caballeronia]
MNRRAQLESVKEEQEEMNSGSLFEVFVRNTNRGVAASYTSLRDGETVERTLTHVELLQRARALAGWMKQKGFSGKRAIMVFPVGLEFVEAFLACLMANVIAVPVAPVPLTGDSNKVRRMLAIMEDCQPSLVLGVSKSIGNSALFVGRYPQYGNLTWLEVDRFDEWDSLSDLSFDMPSPEAIALLQYTSGSTGMPKGVMLSHRNILSNLQQWDQGLGHDDDSKLVCWVPHYHDLGLLYGILFPMYRCISAYLLPGVAVAQKPSRWLRAISDFKGTHSMGPNFIYGHCCERMTEQECEGLDLSSWRMALNAAEPIRAETVERFTRKFRPFGFDPLAMTAAYGLAEATCIVTGQNWDSPCRILRLSDKELQRNKVRLAGPDETVASLVACGQPLSDTIVKIVDPAGLTECAPDEAGEIWVSGDNVASGYWMRPDESAATFGATLPSVPGKVFLRTGDLGFIHEGEVFTTGRIKDLIIVRGANYYPQDAESLLERAHPGFVHGSCAVFSVLKEGEERVVVVQELTRGHRNGPYEEMFDAIRRAVGAAFDLPVESIALIQPGTTAKTSSGKIQRRQSRQAFLDGSLRLVATWSRERNADVPAVGTAAPAQANSEKMEHFLIRRIADISRLSPESIRVDRPFSEYGLGSLDSTRIAEELAVHFKIAVSPAMFYDHPDVQRLAAHLGSLVRTPAPASGQPRVATASPDADTLVVVGMACRFPGASHLAAYWELLSEGRSGVGTRREADGATRHGGFVDDVGQFDNAFFMITNREAACIDPQQRMAMQVAWNALEDAGIIPSTLAGTETGVFFGASAFDYGSLQLAHSELDAYSNQGSVLAVIANRIAYHLDLRGPSFVVDTACSSALTAVHLACRSLRERECRTALVGAVNVLLAKDWDIGLTKAGMLAPDGQCKTFDAAADGYVRSEGCGVPVVKRYEDALADGDRIYGAILGTAINQDGRSNGLTAPNGSAQEALVLRALADAKVDPSDLQYVEAHGTGTALGDSIECRALSRVLAQGAHAEGKPCYLGSAKANVGHLEAAAGMAGIIKTLLMLHHGSIPMQRNLSRLNPLLDLGARLRISRTRVDWPSSTEARRYASVSAFGFSGANACVVVGDASDAAGAQPAPVPSSDVLPFVMSARDRAALDRLAVSYVEMLSTLPAQDWPDFTYTSSCRRTPQDVRFAVTADGPAALAAKLQALVQGSDEYVSRRAAPKIAFVYTGQGMPLKNAAREFRRMPVFQDTLKRCNEVLQPVLGMTLDAWLYEDATGPLTRRPALAQPVHFALQYAISQVVLSFGIRADLALGHSLGEYAALVTCGAMTLEDALRLVLVRGDLCENRVASGSMATVFSDEDTVRRAILLANGQVELAAVNGPQHCVVSGTTDAVSQFCARLKEQRGIDSRKLQVERPYHSALLEPALPALMNAAEALELHAPEIGFVSTVTGSLWSPGKKLNGHYFARQLREPVRFADSLQTLARAGIDLAIEIGSRPVLCALGKACLGDAGPRWLPLLRQDDRDHENVIESLLDAMGAGADIDWRPFFDASSRKILSLPVYEFEKVQHWFQSRSPELPSPDVPAATTQLPTRSDPSIPFVGLPAWDAVVRRGEQALDGFRAAERPALARFEDIWQRLEEACPLVMAASLAELGQFRQPGETASAQSICKRFGLKANRLAPLGQWLMTLEQTGFVKAAGSDGLFRNLVAFDAVKLRSQVATLFATIQADDDVRPFVDYVRACAFSQVGLLKGLTNPLDLLFPDGQTSVADSLYQLNPVSRMQNRIAAEVLGALVARHTASRRTPMRILELGAGTGGTTAALLKALPQSGVVYRFTDVSHFFTDRARAHFAAVPFIEYGLFDLDKGFAEQGYQAASFDLILAANAVHAAKYIDRTLLDLRRLLAPGGVTMLIEGTVNTPIQMLTLAHIESFGHYQDHRKVSNLPFMAIDQWRECVLKAGFEHFSAIPGTGVSSTAWPQNVLLAFASETNAALPPAAAYGAPAIHPPAAVAKKAPSSDARTEPGVNTMDSLKSLLAKLIHVDAASIDPHATYMELGVDSIVLMEFTRVVSRQRGMKLTVPQLFEHYPSLDALSRFLDARETSQARLQDIDAAQEIS